MTPDRASENLFYDVVPFEPMVEEYRRFRKVMEVFSEPVFIRDRLAVELRDEGGLARQWLVDHGLLAGLHRSKAARLHTWLMKASVEDLIQGLVGGREKRSDTLEDYLSGETHDLAPLPNLFFTRDPGFVIGSDLFISAMAHPVRRREGLLTALALGAWRLDDRSTTPDTGSIPRMHILTGSIEGGDVLVLDESTIVVGLSQRTNPRGVDSLISSLASRRNGESNPPVPHRIILVHLPHQRSMIHLDMVFTLVSSTQALMYRPLFEGVRGVRVTGVFWQDREPPRFYEYDSVFQALEAAGHPLEPLWGGGGDATVQQREQWMAGINVCSLDEGLVIAYKNNPATIQTLAHAGFSIMSDQKVLSSRDLMEERPLCITLPGLELARAGGGLRCMTMPLNRAAATR